MGLRHLPRSESRDDFTRWGSGLRWWRWNPFYWPAAFSVGAMLPIRRSILLLKPPRVIFMCNRCVYRLQCYVICSPEKPKITLAADGNRYDASCPGFTSPTAPSTWAWWRDVVLAKAPGRGHRDITVFHQLSAPWPARQTERASTAVDDGENSASAARNTRRNKGKAALGQKRDRLMAVSPKCHRMDLSRSSRALRKAGAGAEGKARTLSSPRLSSFQRLIGNVEENASSCAFITISVMTRILLWRSPN